MNCTCVSAFKSDAPHERGFVPVVRVQDPKCKVHKVAPNHRAAS